MHSVNRFARISLSVLSLRFVSSLGRFLRYLFLRLRRRPSDFGSSLRLQLLNALGGLLGFRSFASAFLGTDFIVPR